MGDVVNVLDGCGKMKGLLQNGTLSQFDLTPKGVYKEVSECNHPSTLFRQNTATTKLMKGYTRLHGECLFSFHSVVHFVRRSSQLQLFLFQFSLFLESLILSHSKRQVLSIVV